MKFYYLDIETDSHKTPTGGIDFANSPIIAITYQALDITTGKSQNTINILKSWESTEGDILKRFHDISRLFDLDQRWDFVPVGFNLNFEFISLLHRWKNIGIQVNATTLFRHPHLDIQPIVTMFNHGIFKGATLQHFSGKKGTGADIKPLYDSKNYSAIEAYIEDETACFLKLFQFITAQLATLGDILIKEQTANGN